MTKTSKFSIIKIVFMKDIIIRFFKWWFLDCVLFYPTFLKRLTIYWSDRRAVGLHVKMFLTPLFHDTSFLGRILSIITRIVMILWGALVVLVVDIFVTLGFIFWLTLPILAVWRLGIWGLLVIPATFVLYIILTFNKPIAYISGDLTKDITWKVGKPVVKRLVGKGDVFPLVLFPSLWKYKEIQRLNQKLNLNTVLVNKEISKNIGNSSVNSSISSDAVLTLASEEAHLLLSQSIDLYHLYTALVRSSTELQRIFAIFGIHLEDVRGAAHWLEKEIRDAHPPHIWSHYYTLNLYGGLNRGWTARPTKILDEYSLDFTKLAQEKRLPRVIGRGEVVENIFRIISRSDRENVMLLGDQGCGKTTLIGGLAQQIIRGNAPETLRYKRIIALDTAKLIAGTKTMGELGERIINIINEIIASGNIILFIDQIEELLRGDEANAIVLSALEPHLSTDEFNAIAATSPDNYKLYIEPRESFANIFQNVEVPETSKEDAVQILFDFAERFEKEHKVVITYKALVAAVDLSARYIHDRVLPEKAISILDEAATMVASRLIKVVTAEDVAAIIVLKTHIPVTTVSEEESKKLLNLEEKLHDRVVDQEEAVKAVADALRRARVGLKSEKRPIGSLLFLGPTGVGKTELSKALADVYFGSEDAVVRLDMSEYQTKDSVDKLIGAPPGSPNAQIGGYLTEAVRRKSFTLVLLDEIEKAHPDIFNIFLQVMEDGRLTDNLGRTIDFSNTIIIATSNASGQLIQDQIKTGVTMDVLKQKVFDDLRTTFRPEFLNRFDGIMVFKPLTEEQVKEIAKMMIKKIQKNLAVKDINLVIKDELVNEFAKRGFDPSLGARPLRRLIQDTLESRIATEMLSGNIKKGATVEFGMELFQSREEKTR